MKQTVAITTLGCKTNQFESAAMAEILGKEEFRVIPFSEPADIYVINTCTVTARTDAESRKLIRRAQRQNPAARIVVTGCYAQLAPDRIREMPEVDLIFGNAEKKEIATLLRETVNGPQVVVSDIAAESAAVRLPLESFAEHTRAFLQIQNGCDAFCSYCIVPYARGKSRSVPPADVLAGIDAFAAQGFLEVVLTGIHLGCYGLDLTPPTSLLALLTVAEEARLVPRLRVGSVEPMEVSPEFIRFLAGSRTVCPHLHIPLQSGSGAVLARMNRHYSRDSFRAVVEKLVADVPGICIGCDVIAGFPGETDAEFAEGLGFIASLPVAYLHVFPFSPRPGTPAATMAGQVEPAVSRERAAVLRQLGEKKRLAFYRSFVGRELEVLVQEREGSGRLRGISRNYIPVQLAGGDELINSETVVKVVGANRQGVRGERVRGG